MITMTATRSSTVNVASHGRRFVLNASLGFVSKAAHLSASVFLVAYVLRQLGLERFGLVVTSATIVAFLGLIQAGAAAGLGRQFNLLLSRGETALLSRHYSAGVVLSCLVAAFIGLSLITLLTVLWRWTGIPPALASEGRWVLGMLGAASALACLALPAIACLQAAHRLDVIEKAQLAGVLFRVVGTLTLFKLMGPRPECYATVLLVEQLIVSGVSVQARRRLLPEVVFQGRGIGRPLLREVAGFNALNLLVNINYVVFLQVPALLLVRVEGLALAGLYGVGLQLNNLIRGLAQPVVNALTPVATSLHATGRGDVMTRLFLLSTKCFFAAGTLLWTLFHFLGEPLLHLWLRHEITPLIVALPWLMVVPALGVAAMPASIFMLALGRVRLPAWTGLLLALAMTATLAWPSAGGSGPPLARISCWLALFFGAYQLVRITDAIVSLKLAGGPLWKSLGAGLLPAAVVTPVLWSVTHWFHIQSVPALVAALAVTLAPVAAVVRFTFFTAGERELLARLKTSLRTASQEEPRA